MDTSNLAKRMKEYEHVNRRHLMRRQPVLLRIDGKAFHSFTKGFQKPFDEVLMKAMQDTMKYLCKNIQNCVLGYTQSDEITLVLVDYKKLNTAAWFDNCQNKIESIGASMATMAFNKYFAHYAKCEINKIQGERLVCRNDESTEAFIERGHARRKLITIYENAIKKGAMFDCRAFNLPIAEVTNNLYWRQLDASRNSIQMLGQANFSHNELQNKSCNDIQDMLVLQKGINWNNLPTYKKRGSCCIKKEYEAVIDDHNDNEDVIIRSYWAIDKDIPIFKGEGREYIEKLIRE